MHAIWSRCFVAATLAATTLWASQAEAILPVPPREHIDVPIADGPYRPEWKALGDSIQGRAPDWFRNVKVGMWLHWGPQSMGRSGDWYAKFMYLQHNDWNRNGGYQNHLRDFGHPTVEGYKEVLNRWKAAKWDPEKLMDLYYRAGARYVLAQGGHHDNFDLWDSKFQPWNSVRVGPHKDIVGLWQKAAKRHDMRFGVAFHQDYSWWWFQPAFLSDADGPLKGKPYDAAQNLDGKGTWWEGLDLKDLYGKNLASCYFPHGNPRTEFYHATPDIFPDKEYGRWYCTKWFNRVKDVVDNYSPDFIYFDGNTYPFSGVATGRGYKSDAFVRIASHFYNTNAARHGGKLDGMIFTKGSEDPRAVCQASESSFPRDIKRDQPWMYEAAIGEWFYKPGVRYDPAMVIHGILEAVSRDGNILINVMLNGDGELDPGGVQVLEGMAAWMSVNGEAIYGSRAWSRWREGGFGMSGTNLAANPRINYSSSDVRFVVGKDGTLYAFAMEWPTNGKLTIPSLAKTAGPIEGVSLMGYEEPLKWEQADDALHVTLPTKKPEKCNYAYGLKISGKGLKPANPRPAPAKK